MRQYAIALATLFLFIAPAQAVEAQGRFGPATEKIRFEPLDWSPGQISQLTQQARAHQVASKGVEGSAVVAESSGQIIVIAAVANTPGGFGSFFTSDLTLVNLSDGPQDIAIFYLARGQDNRNATGVRATLEDAPPITIENILAELGQTGVGSLYIVPITSDANAAFDPVSSIDAYSRLLTPGDEGELSQSFPAIYPDYLEFETEALALGHRQDQNFRVNAGAVNLSETAQNFLVTVFGESELAEFVITVPPFSMNQIAIPAVSFGALSLLFEPESSAAFEWIGYAASNDNRSGDSWSSFAAVVADPSAFTKQ